MLVANKKKYTVILAFLFIVNLGLLFLCPEEEGEKYFIIFLLLYFVSNLISIFRSSNKVKLNKVFDSGLIFYIFIFIWNLLVSFFGLGDPVLVPSPSRLADVFVKLFPNFIPNIKYSMSLMIVSFIFALIIAFPLGVLIGLSKRVGNALSGYINKLSIIPTLAIIPYVIAIAPTFKAASTFIVFTGIFWPILTWTIYGVRNFDYRYTLNAKLLNLSMMQYLIDVLIPGIMPSTLQGISSGIISGFGILIAAEMLGSSEGLGYMIRYYADFLNYHNVIAGIIYLGITIFITASIFNKIRDEILSWQVDNKKES